MEFPQAEPQEGRKEGTYWGPKKKKSKPKKKRRTNLEMTGRNLKSDENRVGSKADKKVEGKVAMLGVNPMN